MKQEIIKKITSLFAIGAGLFHIYTGFFGIVGTQQIICLTLVGVIGFISLPINRNRNKITHVHLIDIFFAALMLFVGIYMSLNYVSLVTSVGAATRIHIILGVVLTLLVLELTRRTIGWPLVIITIIFIAYSLFGEFLPGILKVRSFSLGRVASYLILTSDGIYGPAMSAVSHFVILFVILGAFLRISGLGDFFINAVKNIFSGTRGGPAKVAVVASALYGTISGSSTANVVTTGSFTIPLMKKSGFSANFAGAVEAVASTGGQFTPPIMGTTAFVLASVVGVSYVTVMTAAIIPALLYYLHVFLVVDLRSINLGLKSKKEIINWRYILSGSYKIIPVILLVYLLVGLHLSLMRAAATTIIATIVFSWFERDWRMDLKKIAIALDEGVRGAIIIVSASACAGIVIGMVCLTGLGMRLSGILIELSHGNLIITLILAMIACIILGMGVPTLAAYVIMAMVIAPTIISLGVDRLIAHLFVFYFACFSAITPPVATATYAAVSISGGDIWKTGIMALKLGVIGFAMPFFLVYNPHLIIIGSSFWSIIRAVLAAILSIFLLSTVVEKNFFGRKISVIIQILLLLIVFIIVFLSK